LNAKRPKGLSGDAGSPAFTDGPGTKHGTPANLSHRYDASFTRHASHARSPQRQAVIVEKIVVGLEETR
jgi:hypothetical protein